MGGKRNSDPVNYGDFIEFKVSVERRLTAVETQQVGMKEDINELKETIKQLTEKMDENNRMLSTKIEELKSVILKLPIKSNSKLYAGLGAGGIITGIIAIIILILKAILQVI